MGTFSWDLECGCSANGDLQGFYPLVGSHYSTVCSQFLYSMEAGFLDKSEAVRTGKD